MILFYGRCKDTELSGLSGEPFRLDFYQEFKAEKAAEMLKRKVTTTSTVLRDSDKKEINIFFNCPIFLIKFNILILSEKYNKIIICLN
jgi:hypothetical protein